MSTQPSLKPTEITAENALPVKPRCRNCNREVSLLKPGNWLGLCRSCQQLKARLKRVAGSTTETAKFKCAVCGEPFTPDHRVKAARYCSPACRKEGDRKRSMEYGREKRALARDGEEALGETAVNKFAHAVLWACVQPESMELLPGAQNMTDLEYRKALNSGALEGRYVEQWIYGAKVSHLYRIERGGVAVWVREVMETRE